MKYIFYSLFLCLTLSAMSFAQDDPSLFDPKYHERTKNSAIGVVVDRLTGEFWVETAAGEKLMFSGLEGAHSFTSVRVDDLTYTGNRLRAPQPPPATVQLPEGGAIVTDSSIIYESNIQPQGVKLVQEFTPMLDTDFAFVRIRSTVSNEGIKPRSIGLQYLYFMMTELTRFVEVDVAGTRVEYEREFTGAELPNEFIANAQDSTALLIGRIEHPELVKPDRMVVGNWRWNGYLGAAYWDYNPSGLKIDFFRGVLLQWDEAVLQPGETRTVVSDYGFKIYRKGDLECSVDPIALNNSQTGYEPNPTRVIARYTNKGNVPENNVSLTLQVPSGATLALGENPVYNHIGPVGPEETIITSWQVIIQNAQNGAQLDFPVRLTTAFHEIDCAAQLDVPALPTFEMNLVCPQDVVIERTPDGLDYMDNRFTLSLQLENTGTGLLTNPTAAVDLLPAGVELDGSPSFVQLSPDPLTPGTTGTASWDFTVSKRYTDTTLQIRILVQTDQIGQTLCLVNVEIPGLELPPCQQNGVAVTGTSFHTSFIDNPARDVTPRLSLFFIANEDAVVTIEETFIGQTHTVNVPAGKTITHRLNDSYAFYQPFLDGEAITNRSVKITSDKPITVFSASERPLHTDASLVLPDKALGRSYVSAGYNHTLVDSYEQVLVVATEDNTNLTIRPQRTTLVGTPGKVPIPLVLDEGESWTMFHGFSGRTGSLTGSWVDSDKPVAVIGGMGSGYVPHDYLPRNYLNQLYDQITPEEHLGTEYVAVPFRVRLKGSTFKAVAAEDSVLVRVGNQAGVFLADRGDTHEFLLDEAALVTGTKKFMLVQYANSAWFDFPSNEWGDASMVMVSPTGRFAACHTFPGNFDDRFDSTFVNIVVHNGSEDLVTLNGANLPDTTFKQIPGTAYSYAQILSQDLLHSLGTIDPRGIGVTAYAFTYHDAYTINPGFLIQKNTVDVEAPVSTDYKLAISAYPNPFNPTTTVQLQVPRAGEYNVAVYNTLGVELRRLHSGFLKAGSNEFTLNGANLSSGVYTVKAIGEGNRVETRAVLAK